MYLKYNQARCLITFSDLHRHLQNIQERTHIGRFLQRPRMYQNVNMGYYHTVLKYKTILKIKLPMKTDKNRYLFFVMVKYLRFSGGSKLGIPCFWIQSPYLSCF